jgi:hypothetical protein
MKNTEVIFTLWSSGWLSTIQKNLLAPPSGFYMNMEAAGSSRTLIPPYQTTQCHKPDSHYRETYMASSVNTGTSLEQLLHHVIMSHLCCDPQRSGAICAPGVGSGSLCQQEHKYLEVAILSCDE